MNALAMLQRCGERQANADYIGVPVTVYGTEAPNSTDFVAPEPTARPDHYPLGCEDVTW